MGKKSRKSRAQFVPDVAALQNDGARAAGGYSRQHSSDSTSNSPVSPLPTPASSSASSSDDAYVWSDIPNERGLVICPLNRIHSMLAKSLTPHVLKCKKEFRKLYVCRHNSNHCFSNKTDYNTHFKLCRDSVSASGNALEHPDPSSHDPDLAEEPQGAQALVPIANATLLGFGDEEEIWGEERPSLSEIILKDINCTAIFGNQFRPMPSGLPKKDKQKWRRAEAERVQCVNERKPFSDEMCFDAKIPRPAQMHYNENLAQNENPFIPVGLNPTSHLPETHNAGTGAERSAESTISDSVPQASTGAVPRRFQRSGAGASSSHVEESENHWTRITRREDRRRGR
ncbi:uncharacterized protein LOC108666606 isoform X2 [Hyalella azteca]|uniref:Uncharacterized protein LOC108666606 isoform X2 n=1 Tax=Hyalella azteca TaxID=294128 RepID=A0A8B7N563_HYAAZ|nr:uncharacterized protein LOC108666606 isoform X2 [Hyalella azteca]